MLSEITRHEVSSEALERFATELSTEGSEGDVSFLELHRRFQSHFQIKDDPAETLFRKKFVERIYWHVARVVFEKNLDIEGEVEKRKRKQGGELSAQELIEMLEGTLQCKDIFSRTELQELAT